MLHHFGNKRNLARHRYRKFIQEGLNNEPARNYSGGGLIRSYNGWETLSRMRSEHEHCIDDERVLGSSAFVENVLSQDNIGIQPSSLRHRQGWTLKKLIAVVCSICDVSDSQLFDKARSNKNARAKSLICYWGKEELGLTLREIASRLRISQQAATKWKKQGQAYCEQAKIHLDDLAL